MPGATDKAIRLFTYLRELCALRSTHVRDVSQYEEVIWLGDIPRERDCRCTAWHLGQGNDASAEDRPDLWVEVHKPRLKSPPEVPDDLEQWLKDDITDSSLSKPELFSSIPVIAEEGAGHRERTESLSLDDHPAIFESWMEYVEKQWSPWAQEDRRLQRVQHVYNQLFSIYQKQEKLGEQYELIVGAGLLSWKAPASGSINRHIVSLQARVEFDRLRGIMTVRPAVDGVQPTLEYDMLETTDRPEVADIKALEETIKALNADPWTGPEMEALLRMFANVLATESRYESILDSPAVASRSPVISLSPALVLRRRTRRTFVSFYEQIIEQLRIGGNLPENVRRIVEVVESEAHEDQGNVIPNGALSLPNEHPNKEIFFPLPSNREQRQILERIDQGRGILVQGPPGTGKSHTIANLITHFLATGKRILVTSETLRALNVLRNMLPEEMKALCVFWLGSDPESRDSLETSVQSITQKKVQWDAALERRAVSRLEGRLDSVRKSKAELTGNLRACREADTYQHTKVYGCYSGTLQQIAGQVSSERKRCGWFLDRPSAEKELSVSGEQLTAFWKVHRHLKAERVQELRRELIDIEEFPSPVEFESLVADERAVCTEYDATAGGRSYPGYAQFLNWDSDGRHKFLELLGQINSCYAALTRYHLDFAGVAAKEVASSQETKWHTLLQMTETSIARLSPHLHKAGSLDVTGFQDSRDISVVSADAKALKAHIDAGKRLWFWPLRPKVVKRALYLLREVYVDGHSCDNSRTLALLMDWLEIRRIVHQLGDLWQPYTPLPTGSYAVQAAFYQDMCKPLRDAMNLHQRVEDARSQLVPRPRVRMPRWHEQADVEALRKAIEAANIEDRHTCAKQAFTPMKRLLQEFIRAKEAHGVVVSLLRAVEERNTSLYRSSYAELEGLHTAKDQYRRACQVLSDFRRCSPATAQSYEGTVKDEIWLERFSIFERAWAWAKTETWLRLLCDTGTQKQLERKINDLEKEERALLRQLAAKSSWQHCLARLGENKRQALINWSQEVRLVGRGTGRYAETHRENARKEMETCRSAVPAWVMPLYQLVQTVKPEPSMFDIVIIDEASQSGSDALLLNYIADKMIVVGDDKQIKPVYVGLNREHVDYLRRKHLEEIPRNTSLGLGRSLFDQAALRFPHRVRLTEHFRSMPEIIQFSNNLCYTTDPLVPLRQYGANRLQPIRLVHVKDGYRNGTATHVVNLPEANAIVSQIAECCEDPAYGGRTFGVICLLGHRQSQVIANLLVREIGAEEMEKRDLICGEPYDFQGAERDVIFISMVDAPQDGRPCTRTTSEEAERRFNVAASRARDQMWLFHTPTLNELRPGCLRHRLLDYCTNPRVEQLADIGVDIGELRRMANDPAEREPPSKPPGHFDSWFEVDVYFRIVDRGYRVLPQYKVGGQERFRIDLVVEGLRGRVAVECDGDAVHGPEQFDADMARQRELERCGWTFWRIRGGEFYRSPGKSLESLWGLLGRLGIKPEADWNIDTNEKPAEQACAEVPDISANEEHTVEVHLVSDSSEGKEEEHSDPSASGNCVEEGRLTHAVEWAQHRRRRDREFSPEIIQSAIVGVLTGCPNRTCTLKSIVGRVLKHLEVRTRGNPRAEFEKRVMRNIGAMKRKGVVEEYRAKNRRIRLLAQQDSLF